MKYVMIDNIMPILFTEAMNHSDFNRMGNITSAGMCSIRPNGIEVYGESISLKLKPAKEDVKWIKKFLLKWEE